jgi:hypothetical protein
MELDRLLWFWLAPALFALLYLTTLVLALVFYRRCPAACGVVMTASLISLTATVARAIFQLTFSPIDLPRMTYVLVLFAFSMVNWLGHGLMIVAVFVGRNPPDRFRAMRRFADEDEDWDKPVGAAAADNTDIRIQ